MSSQMIVDLEELILEWARKPNDNTFSKDTRAKIDWSKLSCADIVFNRMKITNSEPEHALNEDPRALRRGPPKTHVLFSSVFTNKTDRPQTHNLRTERRTTTSCRISVMRAVTFGTELKLSLTPPNPLVSASGGFKSDFSLEKTHEATFEEELVWSLDSQIEVHPQSRTKAELLIREDEYDGTFKVETTIEGIVQVRVKAKTGEIIAVATCLDVTEIFTPDKGFLKVCDATPGVPGSAKVKFINTGKCFCRYGVEQKVDVTQLPLE